MLTNFRTLTSAFIDGDLTANGVISASCGSSEEWCSSTTVVQNNSGAWGTGGSFDPTALQAASGNWNSTYTTVSTNSASWAGGADYDDSWLAGLSGGWESTYTTVSSNSAIWGGAGSGDFCSTTVLLNEVSACGGEMSVDGTLSASDMITTTLTADGVYFNTGADRPPELGELVWDETERTLDLGLEGGVVLQIGEEQLINVIAGEEIKDGQVVYASGAFSQGNTGKIVASLYSASSAEGVSPGAVDELFFIGVATQDIAQDASGYITTFGKVRNINVYDGSNVNTDIVGPDNVGGAGNDPDWPVGKVLYISTSAGRLTNTPPESPNKIIPAAMVISQSGNGHRRTLFVRQEHGYHIDELHDVRVINPQQNDVLAFNSTLSSWDNVTSNNWESTFTTVSTNSADWVTYSTNNISVANWVLDEDNLISDDDTKVPTQQSVKFYIDNVVTGINNLKGGYEADTDTPQLDTIPTTYPISAGDTYYITESGLFFDQQVDPGDLIISTTDGASALSSWVIVNRNIQDELIDRWNSTYTTVTAESANWDSTYTTVSSNSASWNGSTKVMASHQLANGQDGCVAIAFDYDSLSNAIPGLCPDSKVFDLDNPAATSSLGGGAIDFQIYRNSATDVAGGNNSCILGGTYNTISDSAHTGDSGTEAWYSSIVGGHYCTIGSNNNTGGGGAGAAYSSIFGGKNHHIGVATIGGAQANLSQYSVIVGGEGNKIGITAGTGNTRYSNYCFAAGLRACADHDNAFVWSDGNSDETIDGVNNTFISKNPYTFNIHALSGMRLVFNVAPQVGQVLTCIDTDGHAIWQDAPESTDLTDIQAASANWESTYTTVSTESANWIGGDYDDSALQAASGNWNSTYSTVQTESSNWDSTYTTVSANSADWADHFDSTFIEAESANWDSTYTTVSAESANWIGGDYDDSALQAASGNWNSTYTTVSTNSASWADHFDSTLIEVTSSDWNSTYTTVSANSADWADHFDSSLIEVTSSDWNSTYTTVLAESSNWDSTYTTVSTNSADWVTYSSNSIYPEASWVIDEDTFTSNLSFKVPTQQSVKAYVDGIVTGINNLKGGYDAGTNTPNLDSPPTVTIQQGDSYYVTASGDFFTIAVDPGDLLIATIDNATLSGDWIVVNRNIDDELIDRWNSTYTTVTAESANWDSTYTIVGTNSANWNSTYTIVLNESANWDSTYTTVLAESATWSDTSTVVQNNSGIWDNSAALAYNDGATNSIEIGLLDSTTQTGDYAITVQGNRNDPGRVAVGANSIAIGRNTLAGASNKANAIAVGNSATSTGNSSIAIGTDTEATASFAIAIGHNSSATGSEGSVAFGQGCNASGLYGTAIGVNCAVGSGATRSNAFGYNVNVNAIGVSEFGRWQQITGPRQGAIRCSGVSGDGQDGSSGLLPMVCITTLNSATAKADGGSTVGSEAGDTIPRGMHTIRQWGSDVFLDANDASGNITTIQLGGGGGNVVETVTSNTYTQPTTTTHTIYNDDDVSVTQDIVATLMSPADHTGTTVHKKIGSSHNVVITPPSGTIDGAASFTLQFENESVSIFSDGTNFFIA